MTFECEGTSYDTSDMDRHDTGEPHEPFIYITRDLRSVFVQTWDRLDGVNVHHADDAEIGLLWQVYGLGPLLRVLGLTGRDPATGQDQPRRRLPTR